MTMPSNGQPATTSSTNNDVGALQIPGDWNAPVAPIHSSSNSLWQLQALLMQQEQEQQQHDQTQQQQPSNTSNIHSNNNNNVAHDHANQDRMDELLTTTEFLYGSKLMTSALALVDSCSSLITKVVAPSGRVAYLVRGSKGDETYLCLCNNPATSSVPSFAGSVHYCSCRSYFESAHKVSIGTAAANNTTKQSFQHGHGHATNTAMGPPLCKHLLALKLLPHLSEGPLDHQSNNNNRHAPLSPPRYHNNNSSSMICPLQKPVTEAEFATLLLNHVSIL